VRKLREEISVKKTAIATVTKGIPFNRIEVRPEDQLPPQSFNQQHQLAPIPALTVALAEAMPPATVAAAAAAAARAAGIAPLPRSQVIC